MATPSVLTVPSMYGDGILYSGPTAYGNQLITNGNFQTDTDWTKGAGVTISNGNANFINAPGVALYQNIGTQSGFVRVEFNITEYTSGTLNVYSGGNQSVGTINVVGNKIGRYTAKVDRNGGNNNIIFGSSNNFTGSITNVSVKEITQGSDFDFTRATTGTRINEEGYIEDVPYNLVAYSESFSTWALTNATATANSETSPDGQNNATLIKDGTTTNRHGIFKTFTDGQDTNNYNFSVYLKNKDRRYAVVTLNETTGSVYYGVVVDLETGEATQENASNVTLQSYKVSAVGNGWYRVCITANVSFRYLTIATSNASTFTPEAYGYNNYTGENKGFYMWGAQVVKGDQPKNYLPTTDRLNLPRLNYPAYGGCPSLLLEPQRTNSITYSNDFTNAAWIKGNSTITANQTIAPDGTLSADLLQLTVAGGNVYDSLGGSGDYAFSVFAKYKDAQFIRLRSTGSYAYFDIQNGVLGSTINVINSKIEDYGNGWFRCTVVGNNSNSLVQIFVSDVDGSNTGTGSVFLWGAQMEAGSYPTSLIHTSGSAVTRSADVANNAGLGTTDTFNDSEGVLYLEVAALANDGTNRQIALSDGGTAQRVYFGFRANANEFLLSSRDSSYIIDTVSDATNFNKYAFKYKSGSFKAFVNGVNLPLTLDGGLLPTGLDRLNFDDGSGGTDFYGKTKAVAVYKTALTDTELANLTSYNNHDLFIPYRSRMQMISADQELQCTEHDITRFL